MKVMHYLNEELHPMRSMNYSDFQKDNTTFIVTVKDPISKDRLDEMNTYIATHLKADHVQGHQSKVGEDHRIRFIVY